MFEFCCVICCGWDCHGASARRQGFDSDWSDRAVQMQRLYVESCRLQVIAFALVNEIDVYHDRIEDDEQDFAIWICDHDPDHDRAWGYAI